MYVHTMNVDEAMSGEYASLRSLGELKCGSLLGE